MNGIVGIFGDDANKRILRNQLLNIIKQNNNQEFEYFNDVDIEIGRFCKSFSYSHNEKAGLKEGIKITIHGTIYRDETLDVEKNINEDYCLNRFLDAGIDFVKGLNGNFLMVIHDGRIKRTYVINDRFAFRPHYYSLINGSLYLAPRTKILLSALDGQDINQEAIFEFFSRGEFWGDRTWYKDIKILEPATLLIYENNTIIKQTYWEMGYHSDRSITDEDYVNLLIDTFRKAVSSRFTTGRRIGTSLSGGMDSRTVIAAMNLVQRKQTASITFGPSDSGEVKIAKKVATISGIDRHSVFDVTPEMILDNANKDVTITEGRLFMGMSFVHPVFETFGQEADVLMDGFAMDLTLGGSYLSHKVLKSTDITTLKNMARSKRLFSNQELKQLLIDEKLDHHIEWLDQTIDDEFNKLSSDEQANLWDEFNMKTHVAWMNIGDVALLDNLEVTHPASDNRFFELLLKIPPEKRINHNIYRSFLMALDKDLANIEYHNTGLKISSPLILWKINRIRIAGTELLKNGLRVFSRGAINIAARKSYVDYDEWFRSNKRWQEFFEGILLDEDDGTSPYLNHEYIQRLLDEQYSGINNALKLMHIATFKMFVKSNQSLS